MPDRSWPPVGGPRVPQPREVVEHLNRNSENHDLSVLPAAIGVILAAIAVWSSWFTAQPEETAVVQRFGRGVRTAGPGLHFKWPVGIESVTMVPTARVLKEEFRFRSVVDMSGRRTQYVDETQYRENRLCLPAI